jgi:hypothetical protein
MAISFVQRTNGAFGAAQASLTVNITAMTAGSFLAMAGEFDDAAGVSTNISVKDSGNVAASIIINPTDAPGIPARYWCAYIPVPTAGATSVTITYSGGNNPAYGDLFIWEIAGIANPIVDKTSSATGTGLNADSGPTGTLSDSAEAAIAYGGDSNVFTTTPTGNWTHLAISTLGALGEEQVLSANTSIHGTGTTSGPGENWSMLVATFMSAPVLNPVPPQPEWPYGKETVYPVQGRTWTGSPMQQQVTPLPQLMGAMVM